MQQIHGLPRLVHDSAPVPPTLDGLRHEIDRLDDALLDLIEQRIAASGAIARLKQSAPGGRLNLRPRRQAAIVERLARRARHASPALIAHVWRELMSHSLQAQVRTEFVLGASRRPETLARGFASGSVRRPRSGASRPPPTRSISPGGRRRWP